MATVITPDNQTIEPEVGSDVLYEIVDGEIVEKQMGAFELLIAKEIYDRLSPFVRQSGLGWAVHEMIFDLAPLNRQRRPDLAFVSVERWPRHRGRPKTPAWGVIPNLAVEVVSPSNSMNEVIGKVHEYFDAGVELVWVILPEYSQVLVYDSPVSNRILSGDDELTGEPVIPGFRLSLAELFDEPEEETEQETPAE